MQLVIDQVYILHGKRFYAIVLIVYMMKTYISLSGFDTSQILSLIVKYGIEGNDRMVLIRPIDERRHVENMLLFHNAKEKTRTGVLT